MKHLPDVWELSNFVYDLNKKLYPDSYGDFVGREVTEQEWIQWARETRAGSERKMPVSMINCATTIYAGPWHNAEARLWHDNIHFSESLSFDFLDELRVAEIQMKQLYAVGAHESYRIAIEADTYGQALYHQLTGDFPIDQRGFARTYINTGMSEFLGGLRC